MKRLLIIPVMAALALSACGSSDPATGKGPGGSYSLAYHVNQACAHHGGVLGLDRSNAVVICGNKVAYDFDH